jgi:hypothetical protein
MKNKREKMNKFETVYKKIINEATDIASEQIVIDCIEDEFLGNDIELRNDWKQHVSSIVMYIEDNALENDDETILNMPYSKLIKFISDALNEYGLMI